MNEEEFFDRVSGSPCINCESCPQEEDSFFCSEGCRVEHAGESDD